MSSKLKVTTKTQRYSEIAALVITSLVALFFWDTFIMYPLKLLVVLFHELGHAIAAIITGGSVDRIAVSYNEGGVAYTIGGSRFLILNAGYLGSAVSGALLLLISSEKTLRTLATEILGVILILITILYLRDLFSVLFAIITAALLIFIGIKVKGRLELLILRLIAVCSSLYAIFDIRSDILTNKQLSQIMPSDANQLAQLTHIPAIVWGGVWMIISLSLLYITVKYIVKKSLNSSDFKTENLSSSSYKTELNEK